MSTFLDRVRSGSGAPETQRLTIIGVDPDISIMGVAVLDVTIPPHAPPVIQRTQILPVNFGTGTGQDQANRACRDISASVSKCVFANLPAGRVVAVIEGQEFYPDPDMPRNKLVSVANALLLTALASGAAYGAFTRQGAECVVVKPATWKGQRSKMADHERTLKALAGWGCTSVDMCVTAPEIHSTCQVDSLDPRSPRPLPSKWGHAMDALGMAVYAAHLLSHGRDIWRET